MSLTESFSPPSKLASPSIRRRWWKGAVTLAPALALIIWMASFRVDCGPESGRAFSGTAGDGVNGRRTLRIATFNIHGGEGRDGGFDLDRTADTLRGCDLVGLNEVHGRYAWETVDQAEWLGRTLGTSWLFAPTEERWWHYQFGNGVLSKIPVAFWRRLPLPRRHGRSFRNAVLVNVDLQGRALHVVVTHLDRSEPRDRQEQWQAVARLFLSLAEPAVLMGDMNTEELETPLAELLASPGVHDPLREVLGDGAPRRIDWILTRGLLTVDAGLRDNGASDHPCVWAEVALDADHNR
ncbi:MAG TPA: endonuclease/exonuclease/phosphatase family protein [Pirellulales bacterium]|nr:endonuclease/exonuclease/phosphatase family protein [Pirellulales bacterium]